MTHSGGGWGGQQIHVVVRKNRGQVSQDFATWRDAMSHVVWTRSDWVARAMVALEDVVDILVSGKGAL